MFKFWGSKKLKSSHYRYEVLGPSKDEVLRGLEEIVGLPTRDLDCYDEPLRLVSLVGSPVQRFSLKSQTQKGLIGSLSIVGKSTLGAEPILEMPLFGAYAACMSGVEGIVHLNKNCDSFPDENGVCQKCGQRLKIIEKTLPGFGKI